MSIEIFVRPDGGEAITPLGLILPGGFGSFSDFSAGQQDLISVICDPEDQGGLVYKFPNDDFPQIGRLQAIPLEAYADDRLIAEIGLCGNFEAEVLTKTRRKGRLILRHTVLL